MELYEKCFGEGLCAFPLTAEQRAAIGDSPGFFPKADTSDILFLILKLYKDRFYSLISTVIWLYLSDCSIEPLNKLLVPDSFGFCPVDYRLPWVCFILLSALGYTTDAISQQTLFASFASQLESAGMWNLAVIIAMMNSDIE